MKEREPKMKLKSATGRKLRYGGVTAILTACIIAVVIIFNVIFSALSQKFLWYADLTPELLFTLSDNAIDLLQNGDPEFEDSTSPIGMVDKLRTENPGEELMIRIIFCDDPDAWTSNTAQRYVYETAKQMEEAFPDHIQVENVNIIWNPSAVSGYAGVTTKSVVVVFGTEYRVRSLNQFYIYDTEDTTEAPWAYNGEKILASAILAVTRAVSPIACFTTNHDEALYDAELAMTLEIAGFQVRTLNLATEEIPANCRLIVVYNPMKDFMVSDGGITSDIDEIAKLDAFLDGTNSMMVFMSADVTEPLTNFEEYLEEWGVSYDRYEEDDRVHPYIVQDTSQSLTVDGHTVKADYVTQGTGGSLTKDLRARSSTPPAVIFKNAMTISYSEQYAPTHYTDEQDKSISFDYGSYGADGTYRSIYDVFVTSDNAVANANGKVVEKSTEQNPLKLMTVTVENRNTSEDDYGYSSVNEASYVIACGSPEFASQKFLQSNAYGNSAFLEYALRIIGQEPVPVGLTFKPFGDDTIDTVTTAEATQYTVVLTVVPAVLALGAGIIVIVRRKNR